jgi:hypothetical protein
MVKIMNPKRFATKVTILSLLMLCFVYKKKLRREALVRFPPAHAGMIYASETL